MDPVNFQFADPNAAILNGIHESAALTQLQQQTQDRQLAQQQQQVAQQQALQQQQDLRTLAMNPNAGHADYAAMMTRYPALAENLGKAVKVMDEGQQQNAVNFGSRVYAAQLSGNDDLAAQLLEDRAKADPAQAQHYTTMANLVRQAPGAARTISALTLAAAMGPDKFSSAFSGLGTEARAEQKQPAEVSKLTAEAREAQVKAGNAPTATVLDNETKRQGILSAEAQRTVANFNAQIAAANSETERGRLTLERDKFVAEQAKTVQTAGADAQGQFDNITQSLNLVRGLQTDLDQTGVLGKWTGVGSTIGKALSYVPGTDAKDFRAKLDTLKSQQFLSQAKEMKGMGALSDAEGARIERAVASLDADQSSDAFKNALGVIETTLAKGHAKLVASGKLPKAGGAFVMTHPVYGNVGDGDINRLMQQFPGATRDQVLQYLRSTGGK